MGGGGGSSSSNATTSTTNTQQIDKRLVTGQGSLGISADSSTVTVNTLDQGIVNHAIDLIAHTADIGDDAYKALLATTKDLLSTSLNSVQLNTTLAGNLAAGSQQLYGQALAQTNDNRYLVVAGLIVVAFVAVKAFGKG